MEKRIKLHDRTFRVMIPAEEIDAAVGRVAERLNKTEFDCQLAFVKISSYEGTQSTGRVQQQLGVDFDIAGRDIIIVEDIVETGHSMNYLLDHLRAKNPASIAICTLFFKPDKFLYEYPIDYAAFPIGNEFIVGYGLDYDQLGRNLKDIYVIDNE